MKTYSYKIPIYYRGKIYDDVEESELFKMRRNHLYQVVTTINRLGSLDGDPIEVESKIAIHPWIPVEIDANLRKVHYLSVDNENPKMTNVDQLPIEVSTSDPIKTEIIAVYYDYYDTKGILWHVEIDENGNRTAEGIDLQTGRKTTEREPGLKQIGIILLLLLLVRIKESLILILDTKYLRTMFLGTSS